MTAKVTIDTARSSRRLLGPATTTLVIVAALLALGAWQLQRKTEKRILIAALNSRLAAAPVMLPPAVRWTGLSPADDEFRRVTVTGNFAEARQAQVFASASPIRKDVAGTGVWAFAPLHIASGETVVVNRGFVPEGQNAPPSAAGTSTTLTGYLRFPEAPTWLTPAADRAKALWFLRDHVSIAQTLGWVETGRLAPFYLDLEAPVPAGGLPKPGPLTVNLKDDHLQYAITWFSLAFAVTVAFGIWLRGEVRKPSRATSSL